MELGFIFREEYVIQYWEFCLWDWLFPLICSFIQSHIYVSIDSGISFILRQRMVFWGNQVCIRHWPQNIYAIHLWINRPCYNATPFHCVAIQIAGVWAVEISFSWPRFSLTYSHHVCLRVWNSWLSNTANAAGSSCTFPAHFQNSPQEPGFL